MTTITPPAASPLPTASIRTRSSIHMFGVWCAIAYILMLLLGWGLIAGFVPPIHPNAGAIQVAAQFRHDHTQIIIGMVVIMFSALVFIPFGAVLTHFIKQIEGGAGVLTYSALLGCAGNMILSFYPAMMWLVAAYRPNRNPQLVYLFSDAGWLQFVGGATVLLAMPLTIAAAALLDRSPTPIFPRWAGYMNLWLVLLILPDQILFLFQHGPFSWNGIFGLWIPVTAFAVWFLTTFHFLRKAVLRERDATSPSNHATEQLTPDMA
jgi:MFS family permease